MLARAFLALLRVGYFLLPVMVQVPAYFALRTGFFKAGALSWFLGIKKDPVEGQLVSSGNLSCART